MSKLKVLPHETLCPDGKVIEATPGVSICDTLLDNGIEIEHACEKSCACTTCHVIVREGFDSLNEQEEKEEDMLDKAWGLEPNSRLSCQAIVAEDDLVVEIPKYTITPNLQIVLEGVNLTNEPVDQFISRARNSVVSNTYTGREYLIGVRAKF